MAKVYLISIALLIFFLICVKSEQVIINFSPQNAFFGDDINVIITCPNDYSLDKIILNRNDGTQKIFQFLSDNQLILTQKDYVSSDFSITAICKNKTNETHFLQNSSSISLNFLDFRIERIINNYTNDEAIIQIFLALKIGGNLVNLNFSDFDIYFSYTNDFSLEKRGNNFFIKFVSTRPIDKLERIIVHLRNFGRNFSQDFKLIISNPLRINVFLDENKIYYPEESVVVPIEAFYKDIKLFSTNVSINVDNAKINRVFDCSDKICINISLPRESSLVRFIISYGNHLIESRKLVNIGKIGLASFFDYENKPITVSMRIDNLQYMLTGNQSFLFSPGIKNISLKYRNIEINLINVNLTEFEESIKLYPLEINERNLKVLDFFVFETNLNAEKIIARIYYDERKLDSENKILAICCENFSLKDRMCRNWNIKSFSQNTISNFVEFEIFSKYFFGIIERLELKLQYNLNKQKFYLNDKIIFKGIVIDNLGRLQDVQLRVIFLNKEYLFSTQNGRIEFILDAPNKEGNYSFKIFSNSSLFVNFVENIYISVEPKIELTLLTNSIRISSINEEFFIEIKNTGQKDLENLIIIVENCKSNVDKIEKIAIDEIIRIKLFDCLNYSNPQILKLILKNEKNEFKFEIPIYFEIYSNQTSSFIPTGRFIFVLDTNTYLSFLISLFLISLSILISRRNEETQKIRGKIFLKRKFR